VAAPVIGSPWLLPRPGRLLETVAGIIGKTHSGSAPKEGKIEMAVKPFVVAPTDYAPTLNIVGEHVTVLASGEATEGYEIFLQRGPEGSGPPPHSHPHVTRRDARR
jgi:hypothetical protein